MIIYRLSPIGSQILHLMGTVPQSPLILIAMGIVELVASVVVPLICYVRMSCFFGICHTLHRIWRHLSQSMATSTIYVCIHWSFLLPCVPRSYEQNLLLSL